jgi:hypothetical protein
MPMSLAASLFLTQAIATTSGAIGYWWVLQQVQFDGILLYVVIASSAIWHLFAWCYRASNITRFPLIWLYLGILSPLLGCVLVMPPFSLVFLLDRPMPFFVTGIVTSLLVYLVSRPAALE